MQFIWIFFFMILLWCAWSPFTFVIRKRGTRIFIKKEVKVIQAGNDMRVRKQWKLKSPLLTHRCTCPHGWTGLDCGEDVKECSSSPCLNGAHCMESDIPGEFSCTCPPFFTGPLCEQHYDPCDLRHNPCLHNSACRAQSDGTALCVCSVGEIQQPNCILLT